LSKLQISWPGPIRTARHHFSWSNQTRYVSSRRERQEKSRSPVANSDPVLCGKNNIRACEVGDKLAQDKKNELYDYIVNFVFPGRGSREQPVITFPGAIKLAMFLPVENAQKNRSVMVRILVRYFAGDPSLIGEIEANAASDAPVAQMARASLANEQPDNSVSLSRKRTLEDLEIEERLVALDRAKVQTGILKAEQFGKELDSFTRVTEQYTQLCNPTSSMDERARLIFKDALMNLLIRNQQVNVPSIEAGVPSEEPVPPVQPIGFLTISSVAHELGYRFDTSQLKKLGGRIARAYYNEYNEAPSKHEQFVDGAVRRVNTYQAKDRALMTREIQAFASEQSV